LKKTSLLLGLSMLLGVWTAQAAFINAPLPSNAYITKNGFNWAWAAPLPGPGNGLDLSYQSQFGWRMPTALELSSFAPLATDFLMAGGNVPFNGTDGVSGAFFSATNAAYTGAGSAGAVATPYFNTTYHHADWQDGLGQTYGPWAGMAGANSLADQLVIRSAATVPEPASLALVAAGLMMLAVRRRRSQS
jgi:hypothetical protein